jgi:tRNA dimethylallyltransferase
MNQTPLIVLFGPTGVGKTAYADQLAQQMPIEIINGDMGQMYTAFGIGTAKPDWQRSAIPHHLFDSIDEPRNYTVVEYRTAVKKLVAEIRARGNVPVIVGGSTLYLSALIFPPRSSEQRLPNTHEYPAVTWQELQELDPVRAAAIHPHDTYRIQRAVALARATGNNPSQYKPVYDPIDDLNIIYLTRPRPELYARINERVTVMLTEGWLQEVQQLLHTPWEQFLLRKKLIGYDTIIRYLHEQNSSYEQMVATIQQATRHYAKRQMTFWRMLSRAVAASDGVPTEDTRQVMMSMVNLGHHETTAVLVKEIA